MRKIALILTFIMLMFSMSISANAVTQIISVESESIVYDALTSSISLKGTVAGAKTNTYVLMEIYSSTSVNDADNVIGAAGAYTVGSNFTFSDVTLPDNLSSTECTIVLTSLYNTHRLILENAFYYAGRTTVIPLIEAIDGKTTVAEVDAVIDSNYKDLGFQYYGDYSNVTSLGIALSDIVSEAFPTSTDIEFEESWEKLFDLLEKGTYAALIHDTETKDVVKKVVENENLATALNLPLSNVDGSFNAYKEASPAMKDTLYTMLLSATYDEPSDLPDIFKSMSAVAYLRHSTISSITKVFTSVSDLKATDYSNYNAITDLTVQDEILKSALAYAQTALSVESVISYFESLAQQKNPGAPSPNPNPPAPSVPSGPSGPSGNVTVKDPAITPLAPPISNTDTTLPKISFSDLGNVQWAESAIMSLAEKGILIGVGDGKFAPNDYVTRGQICKIAVLAFNLTHKGTATEFKDVASDAWYAPYVDILSSNGIINGYGDNRFDPNGYVTRQDLSLIIDRILKIEGIHKERIREFEEFNDNVLISEYAFESIKNLYEYGILNGDGTNVMPLSNATRAQTSQLVYLLID